MFEFRVGSSFEVVSDLFGDGLTLLNRRYVEDPETGTLLIRSAASGARWMAGRTRCGGMDRRSGSSSERCVARTSTGAAS